jgi:hypothetical protein
MNFQPEYSPRFKRSFKKLNAADQKDVKMAVARMLEDPTQPALRTKRIQNAKSIKPFVYEASANGNIRISWQYLDPHSDGIRYIFFRNVGNHDLTLKDP